jgi:hypothetical protein
MIDRAVNVSDMSCDADDYRSTNAKRLQQDKRRAGFKPPLAAEAG